MTIAPKAVLLSHPSPWARGCLRVILLLGLIGTTACKHAQPGTAHPDGPKLKRVNLELEVPDPTAPSLPMRVHRVVQFRDQNAFPVGYAMPLTTDVCADKNCRLLEVTLYWNAVGNFDRLEYPRGKPLTKKEHVPFTVDDYAKLNLILKDQDSLLARQSLASLTSPKALTNGVDGVTGATPSAMKEAVVEGAAYTTWVLWRWANGEIVSKLCDLTAQRCTPPCLKFLLHSKDQRCVGFALNQIMLQPAAGGQYLADAQHVLETGDSQYIELALRYLASAAPDRKNLHARLVESFYRMRDLNSPMILDYFAAERDLPQTTMETLTAHLIQLPYFQVHLILRLLEQNNFSSPTTEANVALLLAKEDFFIARRAYEHLLKQKLGVATQEKVTAFRERYRDRL
ncbi:MAG: hypothetical protein WCO56_21805 [Verrucomicrobiota bacterium]